MAGFRTSSNVAVYLPFEGVDLKTPAPLLSPTKAVWLENFEINGQALYSRLGSLLRSKVSGGGLGQFFSAMSPYYYTNGTKKLFGYSSSPLSAIYDITSTVATVSSSPYSYSNKVNFVTFRDRLYLLDGSSTGAVYDGTSWAPIAFTGPSSADNLITGNSYKARLYLVERDTAITWYGGVDRFSGAMQSWDVSSLLQLGGGILNVFPISLSSGSLVEQCLAFVSTQGEVLVYGGSYPASPDWNLRYRFIIGKPLNAYAYCFFQGDVLLATTSGLVSLSKRVETNSSEGGYETVSKDIDAYWQTITSILIGSSSLQAVNVKYVPKTGNIYVSFPNKLIRNNNYFNKTNVTVGSIFLVYSTIYNTWKFHTYDIDTLSFMAVFDDNLIVAAQYACAVTIERVGTYRDYVSSTGGTANLLCTMLSAPISRYLESGQLQKISGLSIYSYISDTSVSNNIGVSLVENFGRTKTNVTSPNSLVAAYNNPFYNVGSVAPYVQFELTLSTTSSTTDQNTIFAVTVLTESGGLR